jgi:protease-4
MQSTTVRSRPALALLLSVGALVAAPAHARDRALYIPGQTEATPDGALSMSSNPAGLTTTKGWDMRLQFAAGGPDAQPRGAGWGAFLSTAPVGPFSFGLSLEHDVDPVSGLGFVSSAPPSWFATQRVGLAVAAKLGERFSIGTTTRWTANNGLTLDNSWQVGALYRPWRWLSLAVRASELGSETYGFSQSQFGFGVGLRPWFGTDRVTFAGDADWRLGGKLQEAGFAAWARISDGWSLALDTRSFLNPETLATREQRTSLLLRVSFGHVGADIGVNNGSTANSGGMTVGLRASTDHVASTREDAAEVARIRLNGALTERGDAEGTHLGQLLLQLDWLAQQKGNKIVVLHATDFAGNWAQIEELRAAVAKLRKADKKVVFFSDNLGTRGLALAAACDRIVLAPAGLVSAHGVAADFIGLRESLEKIGIVVEAVRFADHKTAPESLTRDEPSQALKEQLQHAVTRSWQNFTEAVALGRDMTPGTVEEILARGATYPEDAQASHLVDAIASEADLPGLLKKWGWRAEDEALADFHLPVERQRSWGVVPKVAIVEVNGSIADHKGGGLLGHSVGGTEMAEVIDKARKTPGVRAIVARIDSPGGGIIGSEAMREALERASEHVTVIASMGGVAASGGYWTSLGAGTVFADRSTVTGSIGAFVLKPSLGGLWQKIGLHVTNTSAGPWSGITDIHRAWTPEEKAMATAQLGRFYGLFLDRVAKRRGLTRDTVEALAGGRIWFGNEALDHKLVDKTGGLLDALRLAKEVAGIEPHEESQIIFLPQQTLVQKLRHQLLGVLGEEQVPQAQAVLESLRIAVGPWMDAAALADLTAGPFALLLTPVDAVAP